MDFSFSEDVRPISELKTRNAALVGHVRETGRPLLLTRRGRGVAVLLDVKEYQQLVEHQQLVEAVVEGREAIESGDVRFHDEAVAILESFGSSDG